jgi:hypothetical protein
MSDLIQLLGQASGPGDVAIILVVGPLGYVADALFAAHGLLPPTAVGACCASTALGCKKAVDSYGTRRSTRVVRKKRALADRASRLQFAMERSRVSLTLDQSNAASALSGALRALNEDLSLWCDDLLCDEDFDMALAEAIAWYRMWLHDCIRHERRSDADLSGTGLAFVPGAGNLDPCRGSE